MTCLDGITERVPSASWVPRLHWMAVLLLLAGPPAMAKVRSDWSAVQAVQPGKRMVVVLYSDEAPRGARKIWGWFASATAEDVTVLLPDGQSRTLERRAVRKVRSVRPIKRRRAGWIIAGIVGGSWQGFMSRVNQSSDKLSVRFMAGMHALVTLPALFVALKTTAMGEIYNIPPQHRGP